MIPKAHSTASSQLQLSVPDPQVGHIAASAVSSERLHYWVALEKRAEPEIMAELPVRDGDGTGIMTSCRCVYGQGTVQLCNCASVQLCKACASCVQGFSADECYLN